jgi:Plant specific eukaryotic initiation factor 4B
VLKSKGSGSNPFGAARPREEVLAEKGKDWRELEEKLESVKIREEKPSFSKKTIGTGNGATGTSQYRTEQAWRKPVNSEETNHVEPTETTRSVNFFYYACTSLYDHLCWLTCWYHCRCL